MRLRKYNVKYAHEAATANFTYTNTTFQLITAVSEQFVFHRVWIPPSTSQVTTSLLKVRPRVCHCLARVAEVIASIFAENKRRTPQNPTI